MAQFLNQEPNPQEKDSAKGATLKPAPERVDWNDAGGQRSERTGACLITGTGQDPSYYSRRELCIGYG